MQPTTSMKIRLAGIQLAQMMEVEVVLRIAMCL
jgi:hypothetical protein